MGDVSSGPYPGYEIPVAAQVNIVYDYQIYLDTDVQYRARTVAQDEVTGLVVSSEWTAAVSVVVVADPTQWHLVDPQNPDRNILDLDIIGEVFQQDQEEEQAVYRPLSRSKVVVLSGEIRGERMTINMEFPSRFKYDAFELIRSGQTPLIFRRNYTGDQWTVKLGSNRTLTILNTQPAMYRVRIDAHQVDDL